MLHHCNESQPYKNCGIHYEDLSRKSLLDKCQLYSSLDGSDKTPPNPEPWESMQLDLHRATPSNLAKGSFRLWYSHCNSNLMQIFAHAMASMLSHVHNGNNQFIRKKSMFQYELRSKNHPWCKPKNWLVSYSDWFTPHFENITKYNFYDWYHWKCTKMCSWGFDWW